MKGTFLQAEQKGLLRKYDYYYRKNLIGYDVFRYIERREKAFVFDLVMNVSKNTMHVRSGRSWCGEESAFDLRPLKKIKLV